MEKKTDNIPAHVAIIPDGNRRWARKRGMPISEGHEEGARNVERLIKYALKKGIQCLSFWGSSMDNLKKRPLEEKIALMDIYKRYFERLLESPEIHENQAKINVIGRWEEQFPEALKKIIHQVIEKTKKYEKKVLNFFLAYSGNDEMIQAIEKIKNSCEKNVKITSEIVEKNLMTAGIPAVDYLIRTGGEPHNSNGFLMWKTAESQLYFSEVSFPDFDEEKFEEALKEYERRGRRFGE